MPNDFEQLVYDAQQANFSGWDFAFLNERLLEDPLPWDYLQRVRQQISTAVAMLDLCTGGGERLASLAPLPRLTIATESYTPNVLIASRRLHKLSFVGWALPTIFFDGRCPPYYAVHLKIVGGQFRHSGLNKFVGAASQESAPPHLKFAPSDEMVHTCASLCDAKKGDKYGP